MNVSMGRTLVAVVSSAGLILGGAASASASSGGHDDHGKYRSGWVKVCQDIKKDRGHDDAKGKGGHEDRDYKGTYKVKDSYGDVTRVYLQGKYDCDEVRVHKGWVKVRVVDEPEGTKLKSDYEQSVYVRKGEYEKVTFDYKVKDWDERGHGHRAA
jgi:hypothetical protein